MRQKHRRRITLPHLEGLDIEIILKIIDVEQELGGLADPRDSLKRMLAAQDRKIGDGVELKKIGAGDHKEIADHHVSCPGGQKI